MHDPYPKRAGPKHLRFFFGGGDLLHTPTTAKFCLVINPGQNIFVTQMLTRTYLR